MTTSRELESITFLSWMTTSAFVDMNRNRGIYDTGLIIAETLAEMNRGLDRGAIIAEAVALARDLANEPANRMTPTILAERAKEQRQKPPALHSPT